MSNATDLVMVIELACLTEDRSNEEQLALMRVAAKLDNERNAQVVTNKRTRPPSRLLCLVNETRLHDPFDKSQRVVHLPAKQQATWERHVELWTEGWPQQSLKPTHQRPVATEAVGDSL